MVMMSLQLTDQLPFKDIYLHAMVRDKDGRKMSKSLGNVIDPLEVIHGCTLKTLMDKLEGGNLAQAEVTRAQQQMTADFAETKGIPQCGADSLRIGLLAYTVQGRDINLDIKRVVGYRSFCNKLWQGTRFLLGCLGDFMPDDAMVQNPETLLTHAAPRDLFILSRLNATIVACTTCLERYEFGKCVQTIQNFFLSNLCAVYLEAIKPLVYSTKAEDAPKAEQARKTLWTCLNVGLKLLHPLCPFVTEELWQRLPGRGVLSGEKGSIMVSSWPLPCEAWNDTRATNNMNAVLECVEASRSLKSELKITKPIDLIVVCSNEASMDVVRQQEDDLAGLVMAKSITVGLELPDGKNYSMRLVNDSYKVYIDAAASMGAGGVEKQIKKLEKDVKMLTPLITKLEAKLTNEKYLSKAKPDAIEKDRATLAEYSGKRAEAVKALAAMK